MDKIYLQKVIKVAIAAPLAYSLAQVLDINPGFSFFGSLMLFVVIWKLPNPIGLKLIVVVKFLSFAIPCLWFLAFVAGLWGINSIIIFLAILLVEWGVKTWAPFLIVSGMLYPIMYLSMIVLNSNAPYTTAVDMSLLTAIGMGLGWLADRLFWPVFEEEGIERQVSETFRTFQEMSDRSFHLVELRDGYLETLTARSEGSMRGANKALKMAAMTGGLNPSERDVWAQAIALQGRLLAHLLAISRLLQENRENPLLQELATELSALGDSLSATFASLSVAIVDQHSRMQLPNPNVEFQQWQTQLRGMREAGTTRSFDLASRLAVGLIEHRLQALVTDLSQSLIWLEARRSAVPADFPLALNPAR